MFVMSTWDFPMKLTCYVMPHNYIPIPFTVLYNLQYYAHFMLFKLVGTYIVQQAGAEKVTKLCGGYLAGKVRS